MDVFLQSYAPHNLPLVLGLAASLLAVLGAGYGLMLGAHRWAIPCRIASWLLVALGFGVYNWLCAHEPPGIRMLLIIGVVLYAMKSVVAVEEAVASGLKLSLVQWMAWAGGWPGMDPHLFARWRTDNHTPPPDTVPTASAFLGKGLVRLGIGALLMAMAHLAHAATGSLILTTALALPGISLVLHFGIFNLACAFWRALGVPVYTLFPAPLASYSLKEFWGKRWNLPFTEMIQRALYRPLSGPIGRKPAALAGFTFSGLLHECAISVPVQEGYGLPMAYFAIHGALVTAERTWNIADALENRPVAARLWTLLWLGAPMAILFHPPFLKGIVWPLVGVAAP